jgi:hypothetical protein
MSNYFCYSWDNADFSWANAEITWKEGCAIIDIVTRIHNKGRGRFKREDLTAEEEEIIIGLISRVKENGYIYRTDEKKVKKTEIKVTSSDIELFIREIEQIKLKVIL